MRRAPDVVSLVAGAGAIVFGAVLLADSTGGLHLTFAWLAPRRNTRRLWPGYSRVSTP